jgi:hypothetical protein
MSWKPISGPGRSHLEEKITRQTTASARCAAEEISMADFGNHLAYPTPDWVAYRREEEIARAHAERRPAVPVLARIVSALRRFARAWARSQAYNSFL